jgi:hypothetical protein
VVDFVAFDIKDEIIQNHQLPVVAEYLPLEFRWGKAL